MNYMIWILFQIFAMSFTFTAPVRSTETPALELPSNSTPQEVWIGEVFTDSNRLSYGHYVFIKRQRKVRYDGSALIDVSYAVLKRDGKTLARFDDNIYFGMGNNIRLGLVSLL